MTAIKMARECMKKTPATMQEAVLFVSGKSDHVYTAIEGYGERLLLAMHSMRQAEIDAKESEIAELVECLSECEGVLATLAKEPNVNPWLVDVRRLLAKHRPDAFAKRDDGLIEGDGV